MRKFFPAFVSFIIFSNALLCQTNKIDKWSISYTPSIILSSPVPLWGIQPGAEYRITSRLSLLTEIAFAIETKKDSSYSNGKYFRIKPELHYNFEQRSRWLGSYVGLQLSYSSRKWNNLSGGTYFLKTEFDDSCFSYQTATIRSPILTASMQVGNLVKLSDHVSIDFFWGIGMRTIFTNYSSIENSLKKDSYFRTCSPIHITAAYRIDRTVARFHMNSGIRIFYIF